MPEITDTRIKLVDSTPNGKARLLAYVSITLDGGFVVRDLKLIDGSRGMFVAMPSRKLSDRCSRCATKNHLRARFCNFCGLRLDEQRATRGTEGRAKLHADIAHPICSSSREYIEDVVVRAYFREVQLSLLPGYVSSYDAFDERAHDNHDELEDRSANGTSVVNRVSWPK